MIISNAPPWKDERALRIIKNAGLEPQFRYLLEEDGIDPSIAARLFSTNAAEFYGLPFKGKIQAGMDADMILMDQKLNLTYVMAKGQMMMDQGELIVQSTFSA